jgi:lipopolysaccharide export system protein LptA/lipopolysaccharide export system protein LptC
MRNRRSILLIACCAAALGMLFLLSGPIRLKKMRSPDQTPPVPIPDIKDLKQQSVREFFYPRYEGDRLQFEAKGESAKMLSQDEFQVAKPEIVFYGENKGASGRTYVVNLTATQGRIHKKEDWSEVTGQVHMTSDQGVTLDTNTLRSNFADRSILAPAQVDIRSRDVRISGRRFAGNVQLETFTLSESIRTDFDSAVKESPWSRPDTQRPPVHVTVICAGPMSADVISQEDSPERIQRLIFNRDVHLVLTDAQEEWLVDCNRLETVFSVPEENRGPGGGAESGSSGAELRQLLATGDVRTSGSRFELYCDELSIKPNETGGRTAVASGTRKRIIVKGGAGVMPGAGLSSSKGGTGGDMEVFCGADVVFTQGGSRPDSIRGSRAEFRDNVVVRSDQGTIFCDELTLNMSEASLAGGGQLESMRANGRATLLREGLTASGLTLTWDNRAGTMLIVGAPDAWVVNEEQGVRIRSNRIEMDNTTGKMTCDGNSRMIFEGARREDGPKIGFPGLKGGGDSGTWEISSDRLVASADRSMQSLNYLEATSGVTINSGKIVARSQTFLWDNSTSRMSLGGAPNASVQSGEMIAEAPTIVVDTQSNRMILRGAGKRIVFKGKAGDKVAGGNAQQVEDVEATSHGDIFTASGGDEILATIDKKTQDLSRILAHGSVIVVRGIQKAYGNRVIWDTGTGQAKILGRPIAKLCREADIMEAYEITADQNWSRVTATNPTGPGRIIIQPR